MKTLREVKNEVAKGNGFHDWDEYSDVSANREKYNSQFDKAAEMYAQQYWDMANDLQTRLFQATRYINFSGKLTEYMDMCERLSEVNDCNKLTILNQRQEIGELKATIEYEQENCGRLEGMVSSLSRDLENKDKNEKRLIERVMELETLNPNYYMDKCDKLQMENDKLKRLLDKVAKAIK